MTAFLEREYASERLPLVCRSLLELLRLSAVDTADMNAPGVGLRADFADRFEDAICLSGDDSGEAGAEEESREPGAA